MRLSRPKDIVPDIRFRGSALGTGATFLSPPIIKSNRLGILSATLTRARARDPLILSGARAGERGVFRIRQEV